MLLLHPTTPPSNTRPVWRPPGTFTLGRAAGGELGIQVSPRRERSFGKAHLGATAVSSSMPYGWTGARGKRCRNNKDLARDGFCGTDYIFIYYSGQLLSGGIPMLTVDILPGSR